MNRRLIGHVLVLLISIVVGFVAGHLFFGLFLGIVPQAVLTPIMRATMQVSCYSYGVGIGVVMYLWTLLGGGILKVFSIGSGKKGAPAIKP
ncbi:MAG: hypothetical protein U0527_17665 [Candidatus Eisenbacteria bacterium]